MNNLLLCLKIIPINFLGKDNMGKIITKIHPPLPLPNKPHQKEKLFHKKMSKYCPENRATLYRLKMLFKQVEK